MIKALVQIKMHDITLLMIFI